jgi:hypothetical protein
MTIWGDETAKTIKRKHVYLTIEEIKKYWEK